EPVRDHLLPALAASLEDSKWGDRERREIVQFYRNFAGDSPDALTPLQSRLAQDRPGQTTPEQAKRKAAIAAALVALGRGEEVWPLLVHTPEPTLRSYLIERLGTSDVDPKVLKTRLDVEKDISARRALILALGGFPPDRLPELGPYLLGLYKNDPDAGIHGAAGWALRQWWEEGDHDELRRIDERLATAGIKEGRRWLVNKQLQTLAIIQRPAQEALGKDKSSGGVSHRFAIGFTE